MRIISKLTKCVLYFVVASFVFGSAPVYAQDAAGTEDAGLKAVMERLGELQERVGDLEKKVREQDGIIKRQKEALEKTSQYIPELKALLAPPERKVLVSKFALKGVNLFTPSDFEPILSKYRDKELGLSDLKNIADEITGFYRSEGYITSLAYAPTQEIADDTVEFRIIEGRVGEIEVAGGEYYSKETLERKLLVEKGEVLDYEKLRQDITRINKQPDRTVKAVLLPGEEQGTSNILVKMEEEENPMHFYLDYNNRGTSYTTENRFGLGFIHNNLLGYDDVLSLRYRMGEILEVYTASLDYNFPVSRYDTRLGVYGGVSHADIGGQFKVLSPEGRATVYGVYLTHPLFDRDFADPIALNLASSVSAGLDSVSVRNKILGRETSHDELRVIKAGISFDEKDELGRTFMSNELRIGLSDFLGSLDKDEESASRIDAGADFVKYVGTLQRVTRLPFSSMLINSLKVQATDNPLVNSEQMAFGGADSIRGFPENDYLGDYGYICTLELRTPAFIFPRTMKVPRDEKDTALMDAIQFGYFVDFGKAFIDKPRVGETKDRFLISVGPSLRFDLYDRFRGRLDWGFPMGNEEPTDGSSSTIHLGFQYDF